MVEPAHPIYTVECDTVSVGAALRPLLIKGSGVEIETIQVGEPGRGRELGVLPVEGAPRKPCPHRTDGRVWRVGLDFYPSAPLTRCPNCGTALVPSEDRAPFPAINTPARMHHPDAGDLPAGRIMFAAIGETKSGRPKLRWREAVTNSAAIVVLRTPIGYRGSNAHTGVDGATFPGRILVRGRIAQGIAGHAGSGEQFIALFEHGAMWRTAYGGRLYGSPRAHVYKWDGERIIAATEEERALAEVF